MRSSRRTRSREAVNRPPSAVLMRDFISIAKEESAGKSWISSFEEAEGQMCKSFSQCDKCPAKNNQRSLRERQSDFVQGFPHFSFCCETWKQRLWFIKYTCAWLKLSLHTLCRNKSCNGTCVLLMTFWGFCFEDSAAINTQLSWVRWLFIISILTPLFSILGWFRLFAAIIRYGGPFSDSPLIVRLKSVFIFF